MGTLDRDGFLPLRGRQIRGTMLGYRSPAALSEKLLNRADVREALRGHDFGTLFKLARQWDGTSFVKIADACEIKPERVGRLARGEGSVATFEKIVTIADGLRIPGHMIGLAPRPWETAQSSERHLTSTSNTPEDPVAEPTEGADLRRRDFLTGGISAVTAPGLGLDEIRHITAAMEDARRYLDGDVIEYFGKRIDWCLTRDGKHGPRETLPSVLGLIGAVENSIGNTKQKFRDGLLSIGARSAEFAGWLYRDSRNHGIADYWRDRAIEWARESDNGAMQGYVLLKKSQAAWDDRDPVKMLELAQAAQQDTWELPAHVRAEAAQQEARAHAMLGTDIGHVERKLDESRELLGNARRFETGQPAAQLGGHYGTELLSMQTAICYCEAGRPQRAIAIYKEKLTAGAFSRRDHGYFLSLMGGTLALAGEPDEAARTGLDALGIAAETSSVRTAHELGRLSDRLSPWKHRPLVRELRDALAG
ncbi:XRE family transcriptional regulator [Streptomyces sp. NPDC059142]|uniref:XRE family transcriptional regulator n=1 Tax=Streptomyces sp. NPDC059142 TaxID=3346739 RepID=UPI0036C5259D